MIEQTTRKIHFIEYSPRSGRARDTDSPPWVRLTIKDKSISFGIRTIAKLQMDNAFLKFFYEPTKKIVGWSIKKGLSEVELASKKWRLVKPQPSGWTTTIGGILSNFTNNYSKPSYKLEIKRYVEQQDPFEKGREYYYVQIQDEYEERI